MTLIDLTTSSRPSARLDDLPVAIIGAGPIGLAAAAHLLERDIDFILYEAGATIATSLSSWGHIRLFSPWRHLIDPAAHRLLSTTGWVKPRLDALPTGKELIESYLAPLAALDGIRSRVRTGVTVDAVTREGMDRTRSFGRAAAPFQLRLTEKSRPTDEARSTSQVTARAVIDASGTWSNPNSLGSNGLDPLGAADVADRIVDALPDVLGATRSRFAGRHTTVVGAGHSAANTLLDLATLAGEEPGTRITWMIRNRAAARVAGSPGDELPARASLGTRVQRLVDAGTITLVDRFEIASLSRTADGVDVAGLRNGAIEHIDTDLVVNATGFRPNLAMLREIRLELDEIVEAPRRLAPLIDPNVHSCGTVEPHGFAELQHPEPGFFLAGMKSYGRAPTFLLATGYEQVRSIAAWLAGDMAAARNGELVLPATGVCSTGVVASSCC